MKKLVLGVVGLFVTTLCLPMHAQIKPLSAQWRVSENSTTTTTGSGGSRIWTKTVTVGSGQNVLIIRYYAQADTHVYASANNQLSLRCEVDGTVCDTGAGHILGWNTVQNPGAGVTGGQFDEHDNSISHTWCAPIPKVSFATVHTVTIDLGANNGTDFVFTEGQNLFIDSANYPNANACVSG